MDDNQDPYYVIVSFKDEATFTEVSPLKIAAELRRTVGAVISAKATASGALLIKTCSKEQAEDLLRLDSFLHKEVAVNWPDKLNTTEAFAYAPSLTDCSGVTVAFSSRPACPQQSRVFLHRKPYSTLDQSQLCPPSTSAKPSRRHHYSGQDNCGAQQTESSPLRTPIRQSLSHCRIRHYIGPLTFESVQHPPVTKVLAS